MSRRSDQPERTRRGVLALVAAGLSGTLAGCSGWQSEESVYRKRRTVTDLPTGTSPSASQAAAASARAQLAGDDYAVSLDALEIRRHDLVVHEDYRGVVIRGVVANTGNETVDSVEVRARVENEEGHHLGRYLDSTSDLAPGSTWSFEIVVLESPGDVAAYELAALGSLG